MFEKFNQFAEAAATNVSRRQMLGRLGARRRRPPPRWPACCRYQRRPAGATSRSRATTVPTDAPMVQVSSSRVKADARGITTSAISSVRSRANDLHFDRDGMKTKRPLRLTAKPTRLGQAPASPARHRSGARFARA